jgi:hypothetical protein
MGMMAVMELMNILREKYIFGTHSIKVTRVVLSMNGIAGGG